MTYAQQKNTELTIEGRLLDLIFEGYKIKRVKVATAEGEYCIKIAKELRLELEKKLIPGMWLKLAVEKKINRKTGTHKLKAYQIESSSVSGAVAQPVKTQETKPKTILVCTKSDCCKRGANQLCQLLEKTLEQKGLKQAVTIKPTGCLKRCSSGPNVVLMPDKTRYSNISAGQIAQIIDNHF